MSVEGYIVKKIYDDDCILLIKDIYLGEDGTIDSIHDDVYVVRHGQNGFNDDKDFNYLLDVHIYGL